MTYDSLSRLTSETTRGREVQYQLDDTGAPEQTTYASGHVVDRTFDDLDRLASVVNSGNPLATYQFRGAGGAVHLKDLGNGLSGETTFDDVRRPTEVKIERAGAKSPIYQEATKWNSRYLNEQVTRGDLNGRSKSFDYDGAGRLTRSTTTIFDPGPLGGGIASTTPGFHQKTGSEKTVLAPGGAGVTLTETFNYNPAQSMVSRTLIRQGIPETITSPPDASGRNRPQSVGDLALQWDANGNLAQRGDNRLIYDWRNRLRRVEDAAGQTVAEYDYDAFNRRVEKKVGGDTIETVFHGWREAEEFENGQLKTRRTFGVGLDEIVQVETDLDGNGTLEQTQIPLFDNTGNLIAMANDQGQALERYQYSSYGDVTILTGVLGPEIDQVRVVGDEIWIETNVEVLLDVIEQGIAAGRIELRTTADDTVREITASQPVLPRRSAKRRLVITTTDPPTAGDEVHFVLAAEDLWDEFENEADTGLDLTFPWNDQLLQDTRPPQIQSVVVLDSRLEIQWSEEVDLTAATAQVTLGGQTLGWTLGETGERLIADTDLTTGQQDLVIGTGGVDLSGKGLTESFDLTLQINNASEDQILYLRRDPRELDQSAIGNPYGFHGRPVDAETGLVCMRNRYFDPQLGTFVSADPLGYVDGPSMYAFAGFDPIGKRDQFGLSEDVSAELDEVLEKVEDAADQAAQAFGIDSYDQVLESGSSGTAVRKELETLLNSSHSDPRVLTEVAVEEKGNILSFGRKNTPKGSPVKDVVILKEGVAKGDIRPGVTKAKDVTELVVDLKMGKSGAGLREADTLKRFGVTNLVIKPYGTLAETNRNRVKRLRWANKVRKLPFASGFILGLTAVEAGKAIAEGDLEHAVKVATGQDVIEAAARAAGEHTRESVGNWTDEIGLETGSEVEQMAREIN